MNKPQHNPSSVVAFGAYNVARSEKSGEQIINSSEKFISGEIKENKRSV